MSSTDKLISDYADGVNLLRKAVAGMTPDQLRATPIAGKWSIHEVVCHLADFEIINAERIKRLIAEDNPTVFNADPDHFAERLDYEGRDFETELLLITTIRRHVASILRSLRPEQWERTGTHSTDGPLTVAEIVRRTTGHVPHHIRFIREKRAALEGP